MRSANTAVNETAVVAGLRKTALFASQALLFLGDGLPARGGGGGRNRRVVIGEEAVCGVCHKRLGGSVVAVLPDNAVLHYGCLNRAGAGVGGGSGGVSGGLAGSRPMSAASNSVSSMPMGAGLASQVGWSGNSVSGR
jgi:hypothetical protein